MKALLICPSERPAVRHLSAATPLACAPLLGESLLEYWLSHLATSGTKHVLVLAADRPEQVLALVGNGARWGLEAEVIPESRELDAAHALLKYGAALDSASDLRNISVLDHFPGRNEPLFTSYPDWVAAVRAWIPFARTPDRVGLRELRPGLWVGLNVHLSPEARIHTPCWLGNNVFVGADTAVGPNAIVEEGAFIESFAEVVHSCIGPHTFVGQFVSVRDSIALGNTHIDCATGSVTSVSDPFLLSSLRQPRQPGLTTKWLTRLLDLSFRKREEFEVLSKNLSMDR